MIDKQSFYFSNHACPDNSVSLLSITERFNVKTKSMQDSVVLLLFFIVRLLSVMRGQSLATTANENRLRRISIPDLIHYIIFLS